MERRAWTGSRRPEWISESFAGIRLARQAGRACIAALLLTVVDASAAQPPPPPGPAVSGGPSTDLLGPPPAEGPVVVRAMFTLRDVNDLDDDAETFEFTGMLVLSWRDPRQSFDPREAGVPEKFYQGEFQFNEVSPAWYPQVVLENESGMYETSGVLLRVLPDGTQTLLQTVNAIAEVDLDLRRLPFDEQALEAVFEILGFDERQVRLEVDAGAHDGFLSQLRIPQWHVAGASVSSRSRPAPELGSGRLASQLVLRVEVRRESLFLLRLVVIPLALIVILSWSVFWMDRSSLGDRVSVSFVGILTAVAYQLVVADLLPNVSYFTLIHWFLNVSFILMAATVVVNLAVGACDRAGKSDTGDAVDWSCRWVFPLVYFGLLAVSIFYF